MAGTSRAPSSVAVGEPGHCRLEHLHQRISAGREAASVPRTGPRWSDRTRDHRRHPRRNRARAEHEVPCPCGRCAAVPRGDSRVRQARHPDGNAQRGENRLDRQPHPRMCHRRSFRHGRLRRLDLLRLGRLGGIKTVTRGVPRARSVSARRGRGIGPSLGRQGVTRASAHAAADRSFALGYWCATVDGYHCVDQAEQGLRRPVLADV
jgi:hypothetical protein